MKRKPNKKYVLSSYVTIVNIGDGFLVSHGPRLWRMAFDATTTKLLRLFRSDGLSKSDFTKKMQKSNKNVASNLFEYLKRAKIIIPYGSNEDELLKRDFGLAANDDGEINLNSHNDFSTLAQANLDNFSQKTKKPLRFLLFGGCVMEYLKDYLKVVGLKAGYDVTSFQKWGVASEDIEEIKPDILVYQPGTNAFLGPLWDYMTSISPDERRLRLDEMKIRISSSIDALREMSQGRLVLVHNIAGLQTSPFGRGGFRVKLNFREILTELNLHIENLLKNEQNFMLVDEDLLASRVGLRKMFDDNYYPNSHHGGQFDIKIENNTQYPLMSEVFATEYFECYRLWSGEGKIKCVVCDLDGTLWPGVAAEIGFTWVNSDTTSRWVYMGIHEALWILKSRGILLATSSKNTEEVVITSWAEATKLTTGSGLLKPDEFVIHKINWKKKSQAIADIANAIGIGLDSILFLDDNPVEREEVRQNLPEVQIFNGEMFDLKVFLLSNPRLEVNAWTQEASQRTEMTKAQIQRDHARKSVTSEEDFLRSLQIQVDIEKMQNQKNMDRIIELVQRTNQFNTTLKRYDAETITAMMSQSETCMYTFSAADRFTRYGLVGFVILKGGSVELFVMSCRVLALNIAVPFLVSVLHHSGQIDQRPRGNIIEGPRNEPCRDLFLKAGFKKTKGGGFVLEKVKDLYKVDPTIYKIDFIQEIKKENAA